VEPREEKKKCFKNLSELSDMTRMSVYKCGHRSRSVEVNKKKNLIRTLVLVVRHVW